MTKHSHNHLLSLAKVVDSAYEAWRSHPKDLDYKLKYERAKSQLDNEIKHCKETAFLKDQHH